jgi:hypothetical protein
MTATLPDMAAKKNLRVEVGLRVGHAHLAGSNTMLAAPNQARFMPTPLLPRDAGPGTMGLAEVVAHWPSHSRPEGNTNYDATVSHACSPRQLTASGKAQ